VQIVIPTLITPLPVVQIEVCSQTEKQLCYYVGKYCAEKWNALGIIFCAQEKKTYCCFSSPLAKIIHEHGRPQLGISWGTPKNPNCRGFTAQEFQKLDFSKIDFSAWIEEDVKKNIVPSVQKNISNVPYELLYAIAKVESNLNPYAVNVEGKSYYPESKRAAILRYCMELFGSTWKSIDCYHKGEAKAREYSVYTAKVCAILYNTDVCMF